MTDLFATPTMQLGLAMTVLVVVIAATFWVLGRLHDYTTQDQPRPFGGLSNLEEMLRKGDISEEEFRTIQSSTRAQLMSAGSTKTTSAHSSNSTSEIPKKDSNESALPVSGENQDADDSTTS